MKVNLANLLRQASRAIDPKRDHGAYAWMLNEVADHVTDVIEGRHTLAEFAEFYLMNPLALPSAPTADSPSHAARQERDGINLDCEV